MALNVVEPIYCLDENCTAMMLNELNFSTHVGLAT